MAHKRSDHPDVIAVATIIGTLRGDDTPDTRTGEALARDGQLVQTDLIDLARIALQGSPQDIAQYVRRLARRYRGTAMGEALGSIENLPPAEPAAAQVGDIYAGLRDLRNYIEDGIPKDEWVQPFQIGAFLDCLDAVVGVRPAGESDA